MKVIANGADKAGAYCRQYKSLRCNAACYFGKTEALRTLLAMGIFILLALFGEVCNVADFVRGRAYLYESK